MTTSDYPVDQPLPDRFGFSPILAEERRESMRFPKEPGTDFAAILHPAECEGSVEVVDESLGGLGIVVSEPKLFEVGQTIELVYAGGYLSAEVKHVTLRSDGRYLVGLRCQ